MKRSLILAAVATLTSGAALAQSSVTVYGRLNTSLERQKNITSADNVWVLQNNGSRLGFKGVEDLGGGMKAGFVLEHRFNIDNGASTNGTSFWGGAGTSEVYLGGNFGTVRLGHFTSEAYFATSDYTDLLNHGTGTSSDALYKYLGNDNNKIAYRAPAFGPVTLEGAVSLGEGPTGNRIIDLAANYAGGPLAAGFGYEKVQDGDSQFGFRGAYEFGAALVTGYVQRYTNEAADSSKTIWRLSGMYTMGLTELHAAYGAAGELESNGVVLEEKTKQYTFGANYNLSKRTKLFAFYNRVKADSTDAASAVALGVRHNF
ncbi:porin [Variovorax sp. YR752]|uniref:porin n=1 Tax=Variovorax sp. YR752 TaxID=1884383 RepID=UPI0031382DC1